MSWFIALSAAKVSSWLRGRDRWRHSSRRPQRRRLQRASISWRKRAPCVRGAAPIPYPLSKTSSTGVCRWRTSFSMRASRSRPSFQMKRVRTPISCSRVSRRVRPPSCPRSGILKLRTHFSRASGAVPSSELRKEGLVLIRRYPVETDPHSTAPAVISAVTVLALRYQLTAYDAAYLELARRSNVPIATQDGAILQAAAHLGVPVLSPLSR